MTLESWAMGIVRPVCEHFPMRPCFLFLYIAERVYNNEPFIAIIINATTESREQEIKSRNKGEMEAEQAAQLEKRRTNFYSFANS